MDHLLIGYALSGRKALVVGGGEPALRKTRLLLKTPARLTVVAPDPVAELVALAEIDRLDLVRRGFQAADLDGVSVVFAATADDTADAAVSTAAQTAGIPVNVPDRPDLSTFIVPALIDRDPVVIGVTTGGTAPVLSRRLRAEIEAMLPSGLGRLARFAARFRGAARDLLPTGAARRRFWEDFFSGPLAEAAMSGDAADAARRTMARLNRTPQLAEGIVHIVGAGPGDPDLLTVKALRLLQEADVIVHDRLIGPDILDRARRDAERIDAGKRRADHGMGQDAINALMVARARRGQRVVRLKGGDPFIFGRGGEERDYLIANGIKVVVVPGITAAAGCAAAAGIPLTHRDHASAVTLVTGHGTHGLPQVDWSTLAAPGQTLAIYMGLATAAPLTARLLAAGLPPETPVAVIENGTLPTQRVHRTTISGLVALTEDSRIEGPSLIVVGEVAAAEQRAPAARRASAAL